MAFDTLEPFGAKREDLRAGIIAATIANANKSKSGKPFKPSDFMPSFEEKTEDDELTEQIKEVFSGYPSKPSN